MRRYPNTQSGDTAHAWWRPEITYAGPYAVYAFVPAVHATTTDARYVIYARNGVFTVHVDQNSYHDEWVYLGTYDFGAGN